MEHILLIIEKATDGELWGRVTLDDNLITESASKLELLQKKIKKLLHDFHDLDPMAVHFDIAYDLTAIFSEKKYLNLSEVAQHLGINRSLMAQYAAGKKFPSTERAKDIENAIHELGRDLLGVKIAVRGKRLKQANKVKKKVKQKA
jgi:DNA-binding transcriptional regulator YdaS (Cro superfamily)